jgi:short-subunit dehydrogenase
MGASNVECHQCDLNKAEDCEKLCQKLGQVDALVNNAGVFGPSGEGEQGPLKGDPNQWHEVIHTNLVAPMVLTRHLAPKMVDKGHGYIINIGDVEGSHSGPSHAVYAASKAGLRGFSMSCYEALRDKGVHVTLIEPGNVKGTKMMEETEKAGGQGAIDPDDVAQACLFAFRLSDNCVPSEIVLKALKPHDH